MERKPMTTTTDDEAPRLSRVHRRLIEPGKHDGERDLAYQHTVFCQTSLPYRNPGDDVRLWQRSQGAMFLEIEAGRVYHPALSTTVAVGLPWGTKPRLVLAHLNAEALRQRSPIIEIENSLSAFVRRIRGFKHGREIRAFKDQLTRLANSTFRFVFPTEHGPEQTNEQIIKSFTLWPEKDERQRVLWPSEIRFSIEYFTSLQKHAVPLREADLAALAHSAMALDIYSWLAQRLHRVDRRRPAFIPWEALRQQFGPDYERIRDFRRVFLVALRQVLARYQAARVELDEKGLIVRNSEPPVARRLMQLPRPCA
jgi:hypothetical protein